MKLNKLFHFIPFVIGLLLMTTVFTGCSDDDDELQQTAFGYVQFKIYKSASAATKIGRASCRERVLLLV